MRLDSWRSSVTARIWQSEQTCSAPVRVFMVKTMLAKCSPDGDVTAACDFLMFCDMGWLQQSQTRVIMPTFLAQPARTGQAANPGA